MAGNFCDDLDLLVERMLRHRQKDLGRLIETREKLEPMLVQLRGVHKHIETFLDGRCTAVQKRLADSLNEHMASVDAHQIVHEKLNLEVIDEGWLAGKVLVAKLTGFFRRPLEWIGLLSESDKHRFEVKVRESLEPQLAKVLKEEFKSWETGEATLEMNNETAKMIEFLRSEAADFQRILLEIAKLLGDKGTRPYQHREAAQRVACLVDRPAVVSTS